MEGRMIADGGRALLRRPSRLVDSGRPPPDVVYVTGLGTLPVCLACKIAIGIVCELANRGGHRSCCQPVDLGYLRNALRRGELPKLLLAERVRDGAAAVGIVVRNPCQIGASRMLARERAA